MKSNLDVLFKTDKSLETEGIWIDFSEKIGFLCKRFGGYNAPGVKRAVAKYHKPYARQIEKGTLPPEKEARILTRAFVESTMIGWKGIEVDGEEIEFSVEAAVDLLTDLPDLLEEIIKASSDYENYKEDLGNS